MLLPCTMFDFLHSRLLRKLPKTDSLAEAGLYTLQPANMTVCLCHLRQSHNMFMNGMAWSRCCTDVGFGLQPPLVTQEQNHSCTSQAEQRLGVDVAKHRVGEHSQTSKEECVGLMHEDEAEYGVPARGNHRCQCCMHTSPCFHCPPVRQDKEKVHKPGRTRCMKQT